MENKNTHYLTLSLDDLKEEYVGITENRLVHLLTDEAKKEGEEFLARQWHDPKPKTWQEAYCRIYAIEYQNWQEYENGNDPEIPAFMWETWQESHTEDQAHQKLANAISKLEIEITL